MRQIIGILAKIPHSQVKSLLDKETKVDDGEGTIVVLLEKPPINGDYNQQYYFYAGRVMPGKWVNPHYHVYGLEPYRFLSGTGEMNIGAVVGGRPVLWGGPTPIHPNDVIRVYASNAHSFRNTSDVPVDFVFACPKDHLSDVDRIFVDPPKHY